MFWNAFSLHFAASHKRDHYDGDAYVKTVCISTKYRESLVWMKRGLQRQIERNILAHGLVGALFGRGL